MQAFAHARPASVEEAVKLLGEGDAAVLAGGTDLLALMKDRIATPRLVVSLSGIPELRAVRRAADGSLEAGSMARLEDLLAEPTLARDWRALAQAISGIASPQLRAMGTLGGDLLQRPRCWYYRNGFGLLAEKDGKSLVREGDNRYHAVLGTEGAALFVSPSTLAPALVALGARLRLQGPRGRRELGVAELFRVPRSAVEREHALGADEVLTAVLLPAPGGRRSACYEVRSRAALDWPLAAAAVSFRLEGGKAAAARIVLGHVAPTPWEAKAAARALEGAALDAERARAAGRAALEGARPLSRNAYKVRLGRVAVERALLAALGKEA